jgi:hypothetical protein
MNADSLGHTFAGRNATTRERWAEFANHREQLTQIIQEHVAARARSLCVLGAGNCTDLDLPWLKGRFQDIVLVDLDGNALSDGVRAQLGDSSQGIRRLARDVTDAYQIFDDLIRGRSSLDERMDELREQVARSPALTTSGEKFDCVLSACLLSQLIDAVGMAIPQRDPRYLELVLAIRRQHIGTMLELLAPGGTLILVTDFTSSLTTPELASVPNDQLAAYANLQLKQRNFFTGLHPQAVSDALSQMLPAGSSSPLALSPWKWNLGPRLYLVTAHVSHIAP